MNYSDIKYYDIANGDGVRTSLFVSGCTNHCKGCFNPQTWDFNYGKPFTEETIEEIIESLRPSYIRGLSVLGGDPFHPRNQSSVLELVKRVSNELPNKDIWVWTGYRLEDELVGGIANTEVTYELLSYIDVLVEGRFVESLKDSTLKWRGSSNQRILYPKKLLNNLV